MKGASKETAIKTRKWLSLTLLLVVLAGVGSAVGLWYSAQTNNSNISQTTFTRLPTEIASGAGDTTSPEGPFEGMLAPDFTVKTVEGQVVRLSSFRGRPVILWFMAAWCPSCKSIASVIKNNLDGDEVVIVVDMWTEDVLRRAGLLDRTNVPPPETPGDLKQFISRYGGSRWYLVMDEARLSELYKLRFVDSTFLIGPDGVILLRSDGPIAPSVLREALARAG